MAAAPSENSTRLVRTAGASLQMSVKGTVLANTLGRATSGTAEKESNQSASERRSPGNTKPFLPSFLASTSNPEQRQLTRQEDGRMLPALVN